MALDLFDHSFAALPDLRFHPTAKRIRALVDGEVMLDSTRAWVVWEPRRIVPSYAVPLSDIRGRLIEAQPIPADESSSRSPGCPSPTRDAQ
jgi:uncharacterized protein (DUF427 family)